MRTAFTAIAIVLVGLIGLEFLVARGDDEPQSEQADVATIASRVEAIRGLTFREQPVPVRVTGAQAREEGLSDLDRSYPKERLRADEEVLKLLGLIEPDVDLRTLSGSVFGEGVAGYYDPESKRLRIVEDAAPGPVADIVLAHELNHALEDQRFGLALDPNATDDAALARAALVEGTAMLVMQEYVLAHVGADEAMGALLGAGMSEGPALPKFVEDQLTFPYIGGLQFAAALRQRGGGEWTQLDTAAQSRIPESTEQILHPEKWIAGEKPARVRLDVPLGSEWRRANGRHLGRVADGAARRR